MEEKNVNKGKWQYFFVSIFGVAVFLGMFAVLPRTVLAPPSLSPEFPSNISDFGKPALSDTVQIPPSPEPSFTRLVFVGDIMLARAVEWKMKSAGAAHSFSLWDATLFTDADAVIGNFEGTIRETERIEQTNVMAFDTLPAYIPALNAAGFTHLSLSNNHADDFGQATTDFTRSTLSENNLIPFGDPLQSEEFVTRINGDIPVSLFGFHAFQETADSLVAAIRAEDAAGNFVIIYPHWGNEYEHIPSSAQVSAARTWIAAGADPIIGAHAHVVQRAEVVDGVPVVYSLGNFLFDQDFSRETQVGAVADITLTEESISLTFSPVEIKNRQMFINPSENDALLSWLGIPALTWTHAREASQTP